MRAWLLTLVCLLSMPAFAQDVPGGEGEPDETVAAPETPPTPPAATTPAKKDAKKEASKDAPKDTKKDEKKTPAETPKDAAVTPTSPEKPAEAPPVEDKDALRYDTVLLQGLNKITARVTPLELPLGTTVRFGNLELMARSCWQSPPEEGPENAALLDIWELKPGEPPVQIFKGWMFSSSPALSALEHPVYDITVISCRHRVAKAGTE